MKSEQDFKNWFRSKYRWSMCVEPALGTGDGMPDVCVLPGPGEPLKLVECKIGHFVDGTLYPRKIRPAQINWHRKFMEAGGQSNFVVGVWYEGQWEPYRLMLSSWKQLRPWRHGYRDGLIFPWRFPLT